MSTVALEKYNDNFGIQQRFILCQVPTRGLSAMIPQMDHQIASTLLKWQSTGDSKRPAQVCPHCLTSVSSQEAIAGEPAHVNG
jgi:ribosomal protein L32